MLGNLLRENGLVDELQLRAALGYHHKWGVPLGRWWWTWASAPRARCWSCSPPRCNCPRWTWTPSCWIPSSWTCCP
ncbi:hypothetical protein ACN28S_34840 [Cystobacter fuscus]